MPPLIQLRSQVVHGTRVYRYCTENTSEPEFVYLLKSPGVDSQRGRIDSSESIPGLHKRLQIRALYLLHLVVL
jgi:hypothetical protein